VPFFLQIHCAFLSKLVYPASNPGTLWKPGLKDQGVGDVLYLQFSRTLEESGQPNFQTPTKGHKRMKLSTTVFFVTALLCSSVIFIGCGGAATNTPANTAKANTPANTAPANTAKTDTAPAGDSIGVAECDDYIKKYEACLTKVAAKAPSAEAPMKQAFQTARSGWKAAATTPAGKASLASACKQAMDTAKSTMTAYACEW